MTIVIVKLQDGTYECYDVPGLLTAEMSAELAGGEDPSNYSDIMIDAEAVAASSGVTNPDDYVELPTEAFSLAERRFRSGWDITDGIVRWHVDRARADAFEEVKRVYENIIKKIISDSVYPESLVIAQLALGDTALATVQSVIDTINLRGGEYQSVVDAINSATTGEDLLAVVDSLPTDPYPFVS